MSHSERDEAAKIILALRGFSDELRALMDSIGERTSMPREEVIELQSKFKDLKGRLKEAGKVGTVDGRKRPLTHLESAFYQPGVHSAAVNCLVATNTHPIKSNWFSTLYGMDIDIRHPLAQLQQMYPDV